jgi:hypothetical protein
MIVVRPTIQGIGQVLDQGLALDPALVLALAPIRGIAAAVATVAEGTAIVTVHTPEIAGTLVTRGDLRSSVFLLPIFNFLLYILKALSSFASALLSSSSPLEQ